MNQLGCLRFPKQHTASLQLTVPEDPADLTVMRAVERDVLDPGVVEAALRLAPSRHAVAWRECASPRRAQGRTGANRDAAGALEAIADAGPLDTILAAIKAREHEAIIRELRMLTLKAGPEDIGEIRLTLRQ